MITPRCHVIVFVLSAAMTANVFADDLDQKLMEREWDRHKASGMNPIPVYKKDGKSDAPST